MKKFILYLLMMVGIVGGGNINVTAAAVGAVGAEADVGLTVDVGAAADAALAEALPAESLPEIYIEAINPGYKIEGINNVGEMIVLSRKNSDATNLLANFSLSYTDSSGEPKNLIEFPENFKIVGEKVLLRLASAPDSELANATYTKTLAMDKGPVTLYYNGAAMDSVCWTGKEGCEKTFNSKSPTALVRNPKTGAFEHVPVENYLVNFAEGVATTKVTEFPSEKIVEVPAEDSAGFTDLGEDLADGMGGGGGENLTPVSQCKGLMFSEILSYFSEAKTEQFVEFYNDTAEEILLKDCAVKYKNKTYELSGTVKPEEYIAFYPNEMGFSLTKNPTSSNIIELIDADGATVDRLEYLNGQKKGTAWAWIGYDESGEELWKTTYAATPGEPNNYQEFRTCEAGKVINEATGNCVKITTVAEKVCEIGQYLNPLTNRCKKIEETSTTTCKEGYYLYEATGRCRKIVENTGANYSVTAEEYEESSSFVALYAVLVVGGIGIIYIIYEFRHEIRKKFWRILGKEVTEIKRESKIRKVYQQFREKLHRGAGRH